MTLKTLNDLQDKSGDVYINDIRQEAIKWIKELQEKGSITLSWGQTTMYDVDTPTAMYLHIFIAHFSNITEEDLA
jgi:ribulose-5-phosphate 4-epimerase/fuculose-1-phosphate aldolase